MNSRTPRQDVRFNRRQLLAAAAAMSAAPAWAGERPGPSRVAPAERRDLFPQGVGSGDPDAHSVMLWTRYPLAQDGDRARLRVEVAEDEAFSRVVASTAATVSVAADWTCRVLVGNLQPSRAYWYRFVDGARNASRIGRTITAPADHDRRPARFTFVSCQSINTGASNAYRRMIFDDEHAPEGGKLDFVLHLGDYIYETVWYPQDNPNGVSGRRLYDTVRYPHGERIDLGKNGVIHVPVTLEDYRTLYRAHLADPDLQDARARWPFVCIWDNEEFSDNNFQSMRIVGDKIVASQNRKVASNQAWFEYQPARVVKTSGPSLDSFDAPKVADVLPTKFDENGFGLEPNNRIAVASLTAYRSVRYGPNLELLLTDLFSYKSEPAVGDAALAAMADDRFEGLFPEEALAIHHAGRAYDSGNPPAEIRIGDRSIPNSRKNSPPLTLLGGPQKAWFIERLKTSGATWKVWGQSQGNLFERLDLEHLPEGMKNPWPGARYITSGQAIREQQEICDAVRDGGVTGFVTVSGNRHSFWAGFAARALPPHNPFQPVGVTFVTGAISSSSPFEYYSTIPATERPLGQLSVTDRDGKQEATMNLLYRHGFRTAVEYAASGDLARARALSNPDLAPNIRFLDMGGHGYALVTAAADALECEFVCIEVPRERAKTPDGGPLVYRVVHRAPAWKPGEAPRLEQRVLEGNPVLSL